jgi:peptidoglycan/LPS O-acetylase OafA/YrhL
MITPGRFKVLDSWRGICARVVATYHYPRAFEALNWPVFSAGWVFVDFFFVLSGFVITRRYIVLGKALNMREFLTARIKRLYPMHLITMLIVLAISVAAAALRYAMSSVVRVDGSRISAIGPVKAHA